MTGCTYFEVCKSVKGAVSEVNVYPNPASTETKVELNLMQERLVTIQLVSINGQLLKTFHQQLKQPSGKAIHTLNLNGVTAGIYLISITTDKGERVTQRLIIR